MTEREEVEKQRLVLKDSRNNRFNVDMNKHHPGPLPPTAELTAATQVGSWSFGFRHKLCPCFLTNYFSPTPCSQTQRSGCKSNIIALVRPDMKNPTRTQRWWGRKRGSGGGEVRAEENCKAGGVEARWGEASVMQKTSFRTITRHLELCLPVRRSRKRDNKWKREKRWDMERQVEIDN